MHFAVLVASAALLLSTGCAFGTRNVQLTAPASYRPVAATSATRGTVAIAPFSDGRMSSDGAGAVVGHVRNGYGMRTAEVRTSQNPVEWVRDGIEQSLSAQGYAVERVGAANEARGRPVVAGTVTKLSADTALMLEGDIGAFVSVEVDGVNRFSGLCNGNHRQVGWVAASAEYQSVLASAMEDFIADCGPKLTAAIGSSALVTPVSAPEPARETPALLVPAVATEPVPAVGTEPVPVVAPAAHVTVATSGGPLLGRCKAATVSAMKRDGASEREISGACQATLEETRTFLE